MWSKVKNKIDRYCPPSAYFLFGFLLFSVLIKFISVRSEAFADFFNSYIAAVIRRCLAMLTNLFPFSLAETLILFLPVLLILMVVHGVRMASKGNVASWRYILSLASVLSLLLSLFLCGFSVAYDGTSLSQKLGLEEKPVSAEELYDTAMKLKQETERLASEIQFHYGGFSVMPYSLSEMNDRLNDAYATACQKYTFIQNMKTNVKPVMMSEAMSYTHITGVYTYFTGEANININFPDYTIPYTAAHELAHQRGIAAENEANFVAFLVCIESEDVYIRYSAYLNLFEYVTSALHKASSELYSQVMSDLDQKVYHELVAYSDFFDKYRDNIAADISGTVNDTFLKGQGQTAGSKSYGMVVDLAVAYYADKD